MRKISIGCVSYWLFGGLQVLILWWRSRYFFVAASGSFFLCIAISSLAFIKVYLKVRQISCFPLAPKISSGCDTETTTATARQLLDHCWNDGNIFCVAFHVYFHLRIDQRFSMHYHLVFFVCESLSECTPSSADTRSDPTESQCKRF